MNEAINEINHAVRIESDLHLEMSIEAENARRQNTQDNMLTDVSYELKDNIDGSIPNGVCPYVSLCVSVCLYVSLCVYLYMWMCMCEVLWMTCKLIWLWMTVR